MNFFRRLGLGVAASIFSLLIFLFAAFVSVYFVFDSPGPIKDALRQSGVYEVALQEAFKENQQRHGDGAVPVSDAGVQAAIEQAFPPVELQRTVEQVIDGTYAWVHGDVDKPSFVIDLTSVKTRIADRLAGYLEQRLTALPVCPAGTLPPQDADQMFEQNCRPAGISVASVVQQARQNALASGVLENSTIDASTFKNDEGKPVFDAYKQVPTWHHYYMVSLFVIPLLIVLTAFAVVFASSTRRTGLRRLSVILLTTGVYSTAIAFLAMWGIDRATQKLSEQTNEAQVITEKAVKVLTILANDLRTWWVGFGVAYLVLGIAGLLAVKYLKARNLHSVMSNEKELGHNPNIPQAGTRFGPKQQTAEKPTPPAPKPPKKIQL